MIDYSTKGVAASGNILGKNLYPYLVLYTTKIPMIMYLHLKTDTKIIVKENGRICL